MRRLITMAVMGILFAFVACHPTLTTSLPTQLYSGAWQMMQIVPWHGWQIDSTVNCALQLTENRWEIRPLSTGKCRVWYSRHGRFRRCQSWEVIQLPDPVIHFGPFRKKRIMIDYSIPENQYLGAYLVTKPEDSIRKSLRLDQNKPPKYTVNSYIFKIYDARDSLIYYSGLEFDQQLSSFSSKYFLMYYKSQGTKLIFEDIDVEFPDGTSKQIPFDTIFIR